MGILELVTFFCITLPLAERENFVQWQLQRIVELSQENNHYDSLLHVYYIKPKGLCEADRHKYYFYKMVNEFSINQKTEALKTSEYFDNIFFDEPVPERYEKIVFLMKEELKTWQEDDIPDIARDMKTVRDRINNYKHPEETQRIQKEIIRKLDKQIQDIEKQLEKANASASGKEPSSPLPDDVHSPANISGPGKVNPKDYKDESHAWGKLPEKERAKAMQKKLYQLPESKLKLIEDYYKRAASER